MFVINHRAVLFFFFLVIQSRQSQAEGASVPALGLSNKAVFSGESGMPSSDREISHPSEMYPEIYFAPVNLSSK